MNTMPTALHPRAAKLTIADVAEMRGMTHDQIMDGVKNATIAAPVRWTPVGLEPRWDEHTALAAPVDTVTATRVTPQMHMDELLDELSAYVAVNGHARPRQSEVGRTRHGRTFPLGSRVSATRIQYKRGKIKPADAARFEALPGWTWDKSAAEWHERLDDVVTRWPYHLTKVDRQWLVIQRMRWEVLPVDRRERLLSYPGLLAPAPEVKLREFLAAVEKWMTLNPGKDAGDIPFYARVVLDGKMVPIGRRVTYYRRRAAGKEGVHPLSEADRKLLEMLPGWEWVSHRHPAEKGRRMKAAAEAAAEAEAAAAAGESVDGADD